MLIETKVRIKRKDKEDKDKEIIEYVPSLLNTDHIKSIYPTGLDGILFITLSGDTQVTVKDTMKTFKGK